MTAAAIEEVDAAIVADAAIEAAAQAHQIAAQAASMHVEEATYYSVHKVLTQLVN